MNVNNESFFNNTYREKKIIEFVIIGKNKSGLQIIKMFQLGQNGLYIIRFATDNMEQPISIFYSEIDDASIIIIVLC